MDFPKDRPGTDQAPRRSGWAKAAALVVLILALLAAFIFYRLETWPHRTGVQSVAALERLGRDARDTFVRLAHLQPRVTVNDHVYLEQTTTIAELSVLSRRVEVEHEMMHTWAGSTKRIKLHGTFEVKAGFDLRKKFSVNLHPDKITIDLPHAQILSIEEKDVQVESLENGFWNRISPEDIQSELAILPQLAREKAADLPAEAERAFSRELLEKFHPPQPVRAIFPAPTPNG
ncbi:MAG TPA: DUF4230 domain-containing protein [Chthoniobacterales bacterium]